MGILIIAENRKAFHDYEVLQKFEAGMVLVGSEVKSLRERQLALKDSYVVIKNGECFLQNAHVSFFKASSYNNHEPERLRKLLLNAEEIKRINGALTTKGLTCIPIKVYFKNGLAKVEIALVRGKNKIDKRQSLKKRDADREVQQKLKRR